MREYTNICYYDDKYQVVKLKECIVENIFSFDKQEFILVSKNNRYYFCKDRNGTLYSFCGQEIGNKTFGEAVSIFRKKYVQNGINKDLIERYFENPKKVVKKKKVAKK